MSSASYGIGRATEPLWFRPHTYKNVITLFGGVATIQNRCHVLYRVTSKKKEETFQPFSKAAKNRRGKSRSHDNNKKEGKEEYAEVT